MLQLLLEFVAPYAGWIAGVVAGLLALLGYGYTKKRQGASEALTKALQEGDKLKKKASKDAFKEKRSTNGLSDSDVVDRLRRRTDRWGGM